MFWVASFPPKTANRHLLERLVAKKVEESGQKGNAKLLKTPALGQRQFPAFLRDGVSLHSKKPPLTQAFCPMRPVTVRVTFRPFMTSPTVACPTDWELREVMHHFISAHISSLSSGKATDAFYGSKTMFP